MIFEEAFESRPGQTMTLAMDWGVIKAKEVWAHSIKNSSTAQKFKKLPRPGPIQAE
jgi:hypothetical protein